ncbi:MAG: DUF3307 domain-containing protein [Pseudomonadota bacterium]
MLETFVALLLAHLIGDFALQPDWMAQRKREPGILVVHVGVHVAMTALILGVLAPLPLAVIATTHFAIDLAKARLFRRTPQPLSHFIADQAAHLTVLVAVALAFPALAAASLWPPLLPPEAAAHWSAAIAIAAGIIVAFSAGRYAVTILLADLGLPAGPAEADDALARGGLWIGRLERLLVFALVLVQQFTAIGMLIAAKSILRFNSDAGADAKARRQSEYVIIGTLMSVGWALGAGLLTAAALRHLAP